MTNRRASMAAAATSRTKPGAAAPGATAARSKPVRLTVDLTPEAHARLADWAHAAAREMDLPRLTLTQITREALRMVIDDPETGKALLKRLS